MYFLMIAFPPKLPIFFLLQTFHLAPTSALGDNGVGITEKYVIFIYLFYCQLSYFRESSLAQQSLLCGNLLFLLTLNLKHVIMRIAHV